MVAGEGESGAARRAGPLVKRLFDRSGLSIRLTDERLAHILQHPEMVGLESAIEETLSRPEQSFSP